MTRGGEEVSPLNIPAWRHFPLRRRLKEATGLPVSVDNDAKALTLGEGWVGAAAGEQNFIGMVVSDLPASLAFYRRLGLDIPASAAGREGEPRL